MAPLGNWFTFWLTVDSEFVSCETKTFSIRTSMWIATIFLECNALSNTCGAILHWSFYRMGIEQCFPIVLHHIECGYLFVSSLEGVLRDSVKGQFLPSWSWLTNEERKKAFHMGQLVKLMHPQTYKNKVRRSNVHIIRASMWQGLRKEAHPFVAMLLPSLDKEKGLFILLVKWKNQLNLNPHTSPQGAMLILQTYDITH